MIKKNNRYNKYKFAFIYYDFEQSKSISLINQWADWAFFF